MAPTIEKMLHCIGHIFNRYKIPDYGKILTKTEQWLREISHFNIFLKLDLWYIEQRLGCWCGPQAYGGDNFSVCHIIPFSHHRIFESMLSLPFEYRRKQQLTLDICKRTWPELLSLPFNEFAGAIVTANRYKRKIIWHLDRRLVKKRKYKLATRSRSTIS